VNPQTKIKKLTSLEKIREQVAFENKQFVNNAKELNEEDLYIAWGLYVDELRKKNNHSGVNNFKSARLNIIDCNCIEIVTENNMQQKFIEAERAALIEHLQTHFNNRFLTYRVIIVEDEAQDKAAEKHLSTKEQYLKIIEEYPLVKQLKDTLGLQLDY
jgi:DNA polymerase-3 subunit gamma/tau